MKRKVFHEDENRRRKRQWSRQKCGHCEQFLGHTQYHEHRRLYFNSTLNQWTTVHVLRQKKCEPEDVPGSSSSESEGKISCHSCLLEFPKKKGKPLPKRGFHMIATIAAIIAILWKRPSSDRSDCSDIDR